MYTWGCSTMVDNYMDAKNESSCNSSCVPVVRGLPKSGSSMKKRRLQSVDSVSFHKKTSLPSQKVRCFSL